MSFRLAHLTDVHWMVQPSLFRIWLSKRALGTANLYLGGRRHHFHEHVQETLVNYVVHLNPDAVVVTGDLTAQAIPAEFEKARRALDPILTRFPTFVIPGNHDVYTTRAWRQHRTEKYFGEFMGLDRHRPVGRLDVGPVTLLGLDPNLPGMTAAGEVPRDQLDRLAELLSGDELADRFVVLALHYPLMHRDGRLYDHWGHGLRNVRALVDVLDRARVRPRLVLHGHKHHGSHTILKLSDGGTIDVYNPGSGGYAYNLDAKRSAAVNEYVIEDGRVVRVDRHLFDGRHFAIEGGGAYATGF